MIAAIAGVARVWFRPWRAARTLRDREAGLVLCIRVIDSLLEERGERRPHLRAVK